MFPLVHKVKKSTKKYASGKSGTFYGLWCIIVHCYCVPPLDYARNVRFTKAAGQSGTVVTTLTLSIPFLNILRTLSDVIWTQVSFLCP